MAESPIKITRNDDGLSVRYEFDAHYISDEDDQRIRGYIDQLETENAKLREQGARLFDKTLELGTENTKLLESNKKWMGKAARFEEKNAKLRELLAELYQCSRQVGCDHCGDGYRRTCSVLNYLRELGMEVDG